MTNEEHIELAKRIAAARRGEGPMPSLEELRAAVDSIRVKRAEWTPPTKRGSGEPKPKATVETLNLDSLGI